MRKKKLVALAMSVMMLCATVMPTASVNTCAESTVKISTSSTSASISSVSVYQLFTLSQPTDDEDEGYIVTGFGSAITADNFASIISALYDLELSYSESEEEEQQNCFADCQDLSWSDSAYTQRVQAQILAMCIERATADNDSASLLIAKTLASYLSTTYTTASTSSVTISELGYYLILGTEKDSDTSAAASSYPILGVYGDEESYDVTIKTSYPTVDKLVSDDEELSSSSDSDASQLAELTTVYSDTAHSYYETADHGTDEIYYYALKATLYGDVGYSYYDVYQLTFVDQYSSGINFNQIESVCVTVTNTSGDVVTAFGTNGTKTLDAVENFSSSQNGYLYTLVEKSTWTTFTIKVFDLVSIVGDDYWGNEEYNIVVEVVYSASLDCSTARNLSASNSSATFSDSSKKANVNKVKLYYSANPSTATWTGETNNDGTPKGAGGETGTSSYTPNDNDGETLEDSVFVTSYMMYIYKTDGENTITSDSAKFTISLTEDGDPLYFWTCSTGNYTLCSSATNPYGATYEYDNEVVTELETYEGEILIRGLDAGTYYITEIKAPSGYSILSEPVVFTITVDHYENEDGQSDNVTISSSQVTLIETEISGSSKEVTVNSEQVIGCEIVNNIATPVTLPSTGGVGTVLFYTVGGVLFVGGALLLITKRRAKEFE